MTIFPTDGVTFQGTRSFQEAWGCYILRTLASLWSQMPVTLSAVLSLGARYRHSERGTVTPSAVPSLRARMPILTKTLGRHSERGTVTPSAVPSLRARFSHSQRGSVTPSAIQSFRPRSYWGPTYVFPLKEEWVPVLWEMASFGECLIYRNRKGNCRWASLLTSSPVYQILAIQQKLTLRRLPKYTKGTI